jgi:1-phosphatidylinositol-4-phosphate 5-kinase
MASLKRDCLILQSFGIMDYSLLVGIHNLEREKNNSAIEAYFDAKLQEPMPTKATEGLTPIVKSVQKYDKVFNM